MQLKSKTSLASDQVKMAWKVLEQDQHLHMLLRDSTELGWTVNLEYIGPDNRIVIGYEHPELRVLNFRHRESGAYNFPTGIVEDPYFEYSAERHNPLTYDLAGLPGKQGFEGVVVVLKTGQWFKMKTDWYAALHHTKDSINSRRRLFECIIQETADDLKAMFFDDQFALKLISDMEDLVLPKFNAFVKQVEDFYETNKGLDRKSYAIKGQQELKNTFSLAMSKYLGKEVNFKEWAVKHIEHFGVKDEVLRTVEE